jgi:hypothetical protein
MPRAPSTTRIIRKALVEVLESETVKPYLKLKACSLLLKLRALGPPRKSRIAKSRKKKQQNDLSAILDRIQ